jgi:hypothetical protein
MLLWLFVCSHSADGLRHLPACAVPGEVDDSLAACTVTAGSGTVWWLVSSIGVKEGNEFLVEES